MVQKRYLLVLVVCLAVVIVGLVLPDGESRANLSPTGVLHDELGRSISIPLQKPQRIVSLSPGNTEIIFALGAGNRLVGNTTYCDFPEEAKTVPKMGGFLNPDVESILLAQPDIVFTCGQMQLKTILTLEKAGIQVVAVEPRSMPEVIAAVRLMGRLLHEEAAGSKVAAHLETQLQTVQQAAVTRNKQERVFIEIWDVPMLTAGARSYISDIVTQVGGINVAAHKEADYVSSDLETLYTYNPDLYLVVRNGMVGKGSRVAERAEVADLAAFKNNKVFYVSDDFLARPGPRSFAAMEQVAAILDDRRQGGTK